MKSLPLLLMTVFLSMSASAAETEAPLPSEPEARRTVLGVSVLPLFGSNTLEVGGERVVSPRVSVGLGLRAGVSRAEVEADTPQNLAIDGAYDQSTYLLGVEPMVRIFLTGTAPEGLWVSPRVGFTHQWSNYDNNSDSAVLLTEEGREWSAGGAALLGYSTVVGRGLAVQFGAGLEAQYHRREVTTQVLELGPVGPAVTRERRHRAWTVGERVALSVGWAF